MKSRLIVAAVCAVLTPTLLHAQAVKFELKYKPGEKFVVKSEEKMQQTMSIMGRDFETSVDSSKIVLVTNSGLSDKGVLTRTHTVKETKTQMAMPGGIQLTFDSQNADATQVPAFPGAAQIVDGMKLSAKAKRVYSYGKGNKLLSAKVDGVDLQSLPPQMQAQFKPEAMKKARMEELKLLPKKPVSAGDSWDVDSVLTIGAGQSLKMKTKYTYRGLAKKGDKEYDYIESTISDITLVMDGPGPGGLQITESDVKPVKSTGKLWFDREAGRTHASEQRIQMVGTLTLNAAGQTINADIDLTMNSKSDVQPAR